jgi:hypothetical protein
MVISDFRVFGQASNANANVLGYGSQQAVFQYAVNGVVGNQLGPVIPTAAVPEPSVVSIAGIGVVIVGLVAVRRKGAG